ncbi:hypothetical protein EJ065_3374 [Corallococcus coralloides]|uniref:Uncharacterized protein n=1 Tax=Corallococcus coralloides TaxID=184914 RepID=A0A410RSS0_CORCK|nr:hypothetical protein [Corallococcus coralloides]QAT84937.1 hypothetical protein EJ065_3374 [Corallococcus coralloides]
MTARPDTALTFLPEALWGRAGALASAFLREGHSASLFEAAASYPTLNALMNKQ